MDRADHWYGLLWSWHLLCPYFDPDVSGRCLHAVRRERHRGQRGGAISLRDRDPTGRSSIIHTTRHWMGQYVVGFPGVAFCAFFDLLVEVRGGAQEEPEVSAQPLVFEVTGFMIVQYFVFRGE